MRRSTAGLSRRARKTPKLIGISVMVISGSAEDKERRARYGASWVPKPIYIDELLKMLERV